MWSLMSKLITYEKWVMSGKQSETTLKFNCPWLKVFLCLLQKKSMLHPNMYRKSVHRAMTKKNAGNTSELPLRHIFIEPQVFYKQ